MLKHVNENPTREKIIFLLKKYGPLSIEDLSNELGITSMGIRQHLCHWSGRGTLIMSRNGMA